MTSKTIISCFQKLFSLDLELYYIIYIFRTCIFFLKNDDMCLSKFEISQENFQECPRKNWPKKKKY